MAEEITKMEVEGWGEYRKLILAELERLARSIGDIDRKMDLFRNDEVAKIRKEISDFEIKLATLKTTVDLKSGVWGAIGGMIPAVIAALIWYMTKGR